MYTRSSRQRFSFLELEVVFLFLFLLSLEPTLEQAVQQQQRSSPRAERVALLSLRSSLGLRSRDWPKKSDPCVHWKGIGCVNGSVVSINISGFRRTKDGSRNPKFTADALGNFSNLSSFNASQFMLPGSIPDWFGLRLRSLRVLDLQSCMISNGIPESLGNLRNLTSLYLGGNNITGEIPVSLAQLGQLSVLDLSRNSLTGSIPEAFASLTNLEGLDFSSNNLSGSIPVGIGQLLNLRYLNLSTNGLSSSIPAQLGSLGNLVELDLSFNSLSGSVPEEFRGLRNLNTMVLRNNLLDGSLPVNLFASLVRMQTVIFRDNNFNGTIPTVLLLLPRLHLLDISSNSITGTLPDDSAKANATPAELIMSNNLFYGNLTSILRRFRSVNLSNNYFEGKVPAFLPENASLDGNCLQEEPNQGSLSKCSMFYAQRGLIFAQPPDKEKLGQKYRKLIILASVLSGVGLLLLFLLILLLLFCFRKRITTNQKAVGVGPVPSGTTTPVPPTLPLDFSGSGDTFTYQQLLQATSDFSDMNLIKHGHSGDLYEGSLENGIPIVVKKIDLSEPIKNDTYIFELEFLNKVLHPRLVPLLGQCTEREKEKFIVYSYMPNGDLSRSFYRKTNSEDGSLPSLDWITRLKIAIGIAEGLSFLHHDCSLPIVHGYNKDVQASSILLDDKYEVRLGSLSRVRTQEGNTHESRITKFLQLPQSSEAGAFGSEATTFAYDVYCFGKVLLELVTGEPGRSSSSDTQLKVWLDHTVPYIDIYNKELVTKIVDPSLVFNEDLLDEVWAVAIVARSCLNPEPSRRPPMKYILKALESPFKVVMEENMGSSRHRTWSSDGSWKTVIFESQDHGSFDVEALRPEGSSTRPEGVVDNSRHSRTLNLQVSGQSSSREHSSSLRKYSREIFPEPSRFLDVDRQSSK